MFSCSASWHIKKAKRLDPSLFTTKIDTVRDTIFIEIARVDTTFEYRFDTVKMWLDSVYVEYHYDTLTNTVHLAADCPDQQVITETIEKIEYVEPKLTFWEKIQYSFYLLIAVITIYGIVRFVRK